MKKLITLLFCVGTLSLMAQSVSQLDERMGFKDIKLMSSVEYYNTLELVKELSNEPIGDRVLASGVSLYEGKKGEYTSIGDVPIKKVEVKAYKGMIYEIRVVTDKDQKIYAGLEQAFGKPMNKVGYGNYIWDGNQVKLVFGAEKKKHLFLLYTSPEIIKFLKKEEAASLNEVSSDF